MRTPDSARLRTISRSHLACRRLVDDRHAPVVQVNKDKRTLMEHPGSWEDESEHSEQPWDGPASSSAVYGDHFGTQALQDHQHRQGLWGVCYEDPSGAQAASPRSAEAGQDGYDSPSRGNAYGDPAGTRAASSLSAP